jgi:hypothetical protein
MTSGLLKSAVATIFVIITQSIRISIIIRLTYNALEKFSLVSQDRALLAVRIYSGLRTSQPEALHWMT